MELCVEQMSFCMSRGDEESRLSSRHDSAVSSVHKDTMQRVLRTKGKVPHVAVVGAGIAGLRCADLLLKGGVRVTVFEARDRIGGRVHQAEISGRLVDVGANWIHGNTNGNPITRIAAKTKTLLHKWEDHEAVIDPKGKRMDKNQVKEYSEIFWGIIAKAFLYSNAHSSSIDSRKSLLDYVREELQKAKRDSKEVTEILKLAQTWGSFIGDPIEKQSLKFFFLEESLDGENVFVASTYRKILEEIAATAITSATFRLNTQVDRIGNCKHSEVDGHHVSLHVAHDEPHNHISLNGGSDSCETDECSCFDEIVLTAPLGWLKINKETAFSVPLPERMSEAVDNISYGCLEKVYVTFTEAFWDTPLSEDGTCTGFTLFQSPDYIAHPPAISWSQECVSLATLPGSTAHATLLFYLYGAAARQMVDSITNIPPESSIYYMELDKFFRPLYSKLHNYDVVNSACKPTAFLATQWQNDKLAGYGSYTNCQVGLEAGDKDIEVMRHGLPERALWFAGEHTAPFVALGTTTGAYWAGEAVARRICDLYDIAVPMDDDDGTGPN